MKTTKRKNRHIKTAMTKQSQFVKTNLFEEVELIHNALAGFELNEIKTETSFLGKNFSFPLSIRPITGGTGKAAEFNKKIAVACGKKMIGFSLGSMRAGLEKKENLKYFKFREFCPETYLEANIGALQLGNYSAERIDSFLNEVKADAVSVHLNPAQELMQDANTKGFSNQFENIKIFAEKTSFPVIVKEVGNGISYETAKRLNKTKIKAIDVAGSGGTSFVKVDAIIHKRKRFNEIFGEWGIPTAAALLMAKKASSKKIIASGGIRNGLEIAKAIALGAELAGTAVPALIKAEKGEKKLEELIDSLKQELRISMFLSGAKNISELKKKKFVLQNNLLEWTKQNNL